MYHCTNCGFQLEENDRFCANCGTPVNKSTYSSVQQSSANSHTDNLLNKDVGELKSEALSGNIDAAYLVGQYYLNDEDDILEADKWLELTYNQGGIIHIRGLIESMVIKKVLFESYVRNSNGLIDIAIEEFNNIVEKFCFPAKKMVNAWKIDNELFGEDCYNMAEEFLSSMQICIGRVLLGENTWEKKTSAKRIFCNCINDEFLDSTKKYIASLGFCLADIYAENDVSIPDFVISMKNKASIAYGYFEHTKKSLNRDLDMVEEFIVMLFACEVSRTLGCKTEVIDSFVPYLKNEVYREHFLRCCDVTLNE